MTTARARQAALCAAVLTLAAGSLCLAQGAAVAKASTWRRCPGADSTRIAGLRGVVVDHYRARGRTRRCSNVRRIARASSTAFATSGKLARTVAFRHRHVRCSSSTHRYAVRRVICAGAYRFDLTPAFGRTRVLDTFGAAPGLLSAAWQSPALQDTGTIVVAGGGLVQGVLSTYGAPSADGGNGASSATWKVPFHQDQEAHLTVLTLPAMPGEWIQLADRVSSQSNLIISCYFLRVTPSTGTWDLRVKLNGETSTSIRSFSAPLVAGDSLGLQAQGSRLTAYRRSPTGPWLVVGSTTNTAVSAVGYVSFTLQGTTAQGGAFGGGAIPPT